MNIFLSIFAGKCRICGQKTKWFAKEHVECKETQVKQQLEICTLIFDCIVNNKGEIGEVMKQAGELIEKYNITGVTLDGTIITAINLTVDALIDNDIWTEEADEKMFQYMHRSGLDTMLLISLPGYEKAMKASFMSTLNRGVLPEYKNEDTTINLMKDENIAWSFIYTKFFEQTTNVHYQGGHAGLGIKVAKGLYFRTGAFKGKPVQTTEMKFIANGNCILTNKHIYFQSSIRSLRIPYSKIISMNPYTDGIGIHLDGASSKPILFKDIDGWFAFNAISLLSKM